MSTNFEAELTRRLTHDAVEFTDSIAHGAMRTAKRLEQRRRQWRAASAALIVALTGAALAGGFALVTPALTTPGAGSLSAIIFWSPLIVVAAFFAVVARQLILELTRT